MNPMAKNGRSVVAGALCGLALLMAGLVALWASTDLGSLASPEGVAVAARGLQHSALLPLYIPVGFAIGSALFLPVTAMVAGVALAFDPLHALSYSYLGALLGACLSYGAGRLFGARVLEYASGPRLARFEALLHDNAFRASILMRVVPLGNFAAINMVAGSLRVPFRAYVLGNAVGLIPGVVLLTLFTDRVGAALRAPDPTNIALLAGAVAAVAILWWLRRRRMRQS